MKWYLIITIINEVVKLGPYTEKECMDRIALAQAYLEKAPPSMYKGHLVTKYDVTLRCKQ
jgi:hypothetical protein